MAFPGNAFMEKAPVILPPSREKTLHLGYRANYRLKCPCRCLTGRPEFASFPSPGGAVAQLGERMNGIHEVVGSTPIGSTMLFLG